MASPLTDFCEQVDPRVLSEARTEKFLRGSRMQESFLASLEKRTLLFLARRMPAWVNSDHLTLLGFAAQVMAGVGYALAASNQNWLIAVIACLGLNWFGDSLDGTLARVRNRQRPRYGFYVDHMVDSFGAVALMGGLALSGYMHPYIAIGLLVAFLVLSIQSYLATYTLGEFQLSFWKFGPTELRILLAVGNLAVFRWPYVLKEHYRLFDIGGIVGLIGMAAMIVFFTARNTRRLYLQEQFIGTNVRSFSKV